MSYLACILALALSILARPVPAENWPGFRGPTGQGVSSESDLPFEWDLEKNLAWRTPIPGVGWSSPIVWEDRVFLTTATNGGKTARVLALDAASGTILWNREVFQQTTGKKREQNSYATPTPATDGERVYAVFVGGVAALDLSGAVLWTNTTPTHSSEHGLGASPVLYKELLIMPYDGSDPANQKVGWKIPWAGAKVLAFHKDTGEIAWTGSRFRSRIAHVTPNILQNNGETTLVSGAGDVVQGFDPETGERLWSVYSQGEGVVPSIVLAEGLAFTSSGFEASAIRAVRTDGSARIAWEQTRNVPHIPSFLYVDPHLYAIHENGVAMALEAKTGAVIWQERLGGKHWASPVYADGRIYFLTETCESIVIEPGAELEILARNPLEGRCQASMAVSNGAIFIRSADQLYAVRAQ